jgi:hypothetical protein
MATILGGMCAILDKSVFLRIYATKKRTGGLKDKKKLQFG